MADDQPPHRSRRSLLAAAAGGAAALAAQAALPLTAAAADPNDVVLGATNNATALTKIVTDSGNTESAFEVVKVGTGMAMYGFSGQWAGVAGISVDVGSLAAEDTAYTGVYGYAPTYTQGVGAGVWGDSADYGVYGSGGEVGVFGDGGIGVVGVGTYGVVGEGLTGVQGIATSSSSPGVRADAASSTGLALQANGKVKFSRSGRSTIGTGKSSLVVTLAGTTSASKIFAVLGSNRSGRYVRAVVATTGKFTIYLNTTVTSATYVSWFVLD